MNNNNLKLIMVLLVALNNLLTRSAATGYQLGKLCSMQILPIWRNVPGTRNKETSFASVTSSFWIADRPLLYERFKERIWLLDVPMEELAKLDKVIETLGLGNKRLSNAVQQERVLGDTTLERNDAYTETLDRKTPFILG
jgi:hypothetical protein